MLENKKAYTVTQITKYLKSVMDEDYLLKNLRVSGELSNYKRDFQGHAYFTLKDEDASISCVMFSGDAASLCFEPKDGSNVIVSGSVSLYMKSGRCQIYVKKIEAEGRGQLYERFEALKQALSKEGLFETAHKKSIPEKPGRIAVITSPSGAAVADIISVIKRRDKSVEIVVFPVIVQGEKAAYEIAGAISDCNRLKAADVIIVGRGGGSIEDLWAFNEEQVVRAVYLSEIPIISAVGHETDFTLTDFAADRRAATPSVSAEIAVPLALSKKDKIDGAALELQSSMERYLNAQRTRLMSFAGLIEAVSPLNVMKRGYSITLSSGSAISSAAEVLADDEITTILLDGEIVSRVVKKELK